MSEAIFNFHDTLLLATAFQSFMFVLLIMLAKRDLHTSDYFLVGFFLAQTFIPIHILINFGELFRFKMLEVSPVLGRGLDIAFWLEGPLLLWYTRALLYKDFKLARTDIIFVLPALAYLLYLYWNFFSLDNPGKIDFLLTYPIGQAPSIFHGIEAARTALFVLFGIMCLLEISRAKRQMQHRYSDIEQVDIGWLGLLIITFMVLRSWILLVILIAFLVPELGSETFNLMGLTGNYLMFATISALIFFTLTRSSIFSGKFSKHKADSAPDNFEVDQALTRRIEKHMQERKPYLSQRLNLDELADQLSMHPRSLSITIKQNFDTNFYEFINTYRIEEAKRLLIDASNADKTMIEILGESGFNSKATFNTFFKKLVGSTPTQYRTAKLQDD